MIRSNTRFAPALPRPAAEFLKSLTLRDLLAALVDADKRYREARKLERLDYPHLRDMGIDLGRTREDWHR